MTMKLFNTSSVQDIADAIRARNGLSSTYKIAEMASAVSAIATDGTATADKIFSGYTAYGLNGQKMVGTAQDSGGTAIVVTDEPDEHGGTIRYINGVSLDGDTVSAETLFSGVTAHNNLGSSIVGTYVPPTLSTLTVTPTETAQTFPPAGATYAGYSQVTVNGINSNYVGTNVSRMSSSNLTFTTGTGVFTAPKGYYSANATYTLTPKTSANIAFNSGTGVFTVSSGYYSSNPTYTLTPKTSANIAFYYGIGLFTVASGYYSSSPTLSLSTKVGTTITPTTESQIAVSSGYFTTGSVYVGAIPSTYVQPTGTLNITSNGTFDVKNYASASVSVASGEYYELYRSLANHSVITNNITSVSEYLGALSNILERQFEGQRFSGEFVFSNAKTIQQYGFGNAYTNGFTPFNKNADFVFPICSIISNGAFAFYKAPFTITLSSTSAITIGSSAFLSASITSISVPYCSDIQQYAFASCSSLAGIVASRASKVEQYAFYQCFKLSVANVSGAAVIGSYAFYQCSALTEIQLPVCTSIYMSAFQSCISLQTIYAPNCEYISDYAFSSCSTLASISFSQCINIGQYAFNGCSALSYASLPKLSNLSNGGFTNCRALSSIDLPACSVIHNYAFQSCINMSVVILRNVKTFANYAFRSCYNLLSLYLLGSTMATYATGMFSSTPISNYTTSTGGVYGSIYVPASLYNTYITNTSWKTYSARFVSLTDAQIALI